MSSSRHYRDFRWNKQQERKLRTELYKALRPLVGTEKIIDVANRRPKSGPARSTTTRLGVRAFPGVHTRVVLGDPSKAGFYTILLFVPAHTTIQAHSHKDDRMAVVVSGEWHFGYGDHFDAQSLKTLTPGSVYSEPGGVSHNHFARTDTDAVIVEISGYGPTDTHYFEVANDPRAQEKK